MMKKIFKIRNKKISIPGKLVGAYLTPQVSSYLSLYALSKGITKSIIVKDQMDEWYRNKEITNSVKKLIEVIADNAVYQWKLTNKSLYPKLDLELFQKNLEIELGNKGISNNYIHAILATFESHVK